MKPKTSETIHDSFQEDGFSPWFDHRPFQWQGDDGSFNPGLKSIAHHPHDGEHHERAIHQDLTLSVSPTAASGSYHMHAVLDSPGPTEGRVLLILESGTTYDHTYWDPAVGDGKYSFVDAANKEGYATLSLDRLGLGSSDKPPDSLTAMQYQADELHQLIQSVKNGDLSHYGFSKVVVVGHSYGAMIAQVEAAAYHDTDALVLTSFGHMFNLPVAFQIGASFHPAPGAPAGYLTLDDRTVYYDTAHTSPKVLAWDAAHIGTLTSTEAATVGYALDPAHSVGITVPILQVFGAEDHLYLIDPAALAYEKQLFSSSSDYQQLVLENTGHDINLHESAQHTFDRILDFLEDASAAGHGVHSGDSSTAEQQQHWML